MIYYQSGRPAQHEEMRMFSSLSPFGADAAAAAVQSGVRFHFFHIHFHQARKQLNMSAMVSNAVENQVCGCWHVTRAIISWSFRA